jgi:hypothetical protein
VPIPGLKADVYMKKRGCYRERIGTLREEAHEMREMREAEVGGQVLKLVKNNCPKCHF